VTSGVPARPSRETGATASGAGARPATRRAPLAPVTSLGFDAIARTEGGTSGCCWPADPTGAKGVSSILTAVNTQVAAFTVTGDPLLAPMPLADLHPFSAGTEVFDPKVIYDQYRGHYVLVYLAVNDAEARGWIVIVVIPEASVHDPSTWCATTVSGDGVPGNGRQWADYPGLGFDANAVTVTANTFDFRTQRFSYAQILRFPKDTLYAPGCEVTAGYERFAKRDTRNPDGTKAFTIQPATSVGGTAVAQLLASYERAAGVSKLVLWKVRDTPGGQRLVKRALGVAPASISPYGTQRGGSLNDADTWWDPGDLRLVNAFFDADRDRLYTAHVIAKDLKPDRNVGRYGEAAIRWYDVVPGPTLSEAVVRRTGIVGKPETDAGWPAIASDGEGNVFITFSRASAVAGTREFLSAWAAEIVPGTTDARKRRLRAGEARMEAVPGPERWGDYNGISRDPTDPALIFMVNQFAESDGLGASADWQQTAHLVSHG
jgi:hypothetical protein